MRTSRAIWSITAALVLVGAARASYAGFTSGAGNACISNNDPDIGRWEQGVFNQSATYPKAVYCPVTLGAQQNSSYYYYTLNVRLQDWSSTDVFMCTPYETFNDGTQYYGTTKFSCGNPGGCYEWTTNYMGVGYIQWNGPDLLNAAYHYVSGNYGIRCFIPKWDHGLSYLVAYESTW